MSTLHSASGVVFRETLRSLSTARAPLFSLLPWLFLTGMVAHKAPGATVPLVLVGRVATPVVVFAFFQALAPDLHKSARAWAPFGVSRERAALGILLAIGTVASIAVGLLGVYTALRFHGATDDSPGRDAAMAFAILAFGAWVYTALFGVASSLWRGKFLGVALFFELAFSRIPLFRMITPRSHLTSLLGGADAGSLSARASSVVLALLGVTAAGALFYRFQRRVTPGATSLGALPEPLASDPPVAR